MKLFFALPVTKDAVINTASTIINAVFGLLFLVVVSRLLGSAAFGIFAAAQALQFVLADIFDLGTNIGILRFLPQFKPKDQNFSQTLKVALEIKTAVSLVILFAGLILAKPLSQLIFSDLGYLPTVILSFVILPTLWLGFSVSYCQARQQFMKAAILNLATNIIRLILLGLFIWQSQLTIFTALAIFVLSPLFGFLISPLFLSFDFVFTAKSDWSLVKQFLSFNRWVTLGFIVAAFQARVDSLLLVKIAGPIQAGFYAASSRLLSIYPLISGALSTAYAPSFARKDTTFQKHKIFKTTIFQTVVLAITTIAPFVLARPIINLIYGQEYLPAVASFKILSLAMIFMSLSVPAVTAVIYLFSKPQYYFWATTLQLVIIVSGNILLIPKYGALGSAIAFLAGAAIFYLLTVYYSLLKLRELK